MSSVAGQIRIDLIAQANQFSAGMREGQQAMQNFRGEFEKTRGMTAATSPGTKSFAANEAASWEHATRRLGALRGTPDGFFDPLNPDMSDAQRRVSENRQRRLASNWNASTNSTLSSAEAEAAAGSTADERGDGHGGIRGFAGRMRHLGLGDFGEFKAAAAATEGFSAGTVGVGLFAAGLGIAAASAKDLGADIRTTREEANKLGMTYDQFVRSRGLAEHSRFTEGSALAADTGWQGAKGAGAASFGGLAGLINEFTGRGGSGWSDFQDVANMARHDEAGKLAGRRASAPEGDLLNLTREAANAGKTMEEVARSNWIEKFSPSEQQIRRWDQMAATIKKAKDAAAAKEYKDAAEREAGVMLGGMVNQHDVYTKGKEWGEQRDYRNHLDKMGLDPAAYKVAEDDFRKAQAQRAEDEKDAAQKAHDQAIDDARVADEQARVEQRNSRLKSDLRTPEQVSRDELKDLMDARGTNEGGVLSSEEYARGKSRLAEKMAGEMGGGQIGTVGMLSAGSAEMHSLIAKANMPDPKVALMQEALRILNGIEAELQKQAGEVLQ